MSRYFNGCMHLNLRVSDMDKAMDFYVNKLGFSPMFELVDPLGQKLKYLQIGRGVHLELYDCAQEPVRQFPGQQSFTHFALYVEDLAGTMRELRERGVEFYLDTSTKQPYSEEKGPIRGTCFCNIVWIMDPDGNRIEIMGLTNKSLQVNCDEEWKLLRDSLKDWDAPAESKAAGGA